MTKSIEEILEEFINKYCVTFSEPVALDDRKDVKEAINWLRQVLTEAKAQGTREERKRILKIIAVPKDEVVNVMEKAIRDKILSDINL